MYPERALDVMFVGSLACVVVLLFCLFGVVPLIEDCRFREGQAAQMCNEKVEAIYEKDDSHFVVCADKTVYKLLERK
jgi:hypothetical protein